MTYPPLHGLPAAGGRCRPHCLYHRVSGPRAEDMKIIESSGYQKLDQAALYAVASLHHLPSEAAGRHSIGILEYKLNEGRHENGATGRVAAAITRLQDRLPDLLVPTRYLR